MYNSLIFYEIKTMEEEQKNEYYTKKTKLDIEFLKQKAKIF